MEEEDAEARGASKAAIPSLCGVNDPLENLMKATAFVPVTYNNHSISVQL